MKKLARAFIILGMVFTFWLIVPLIFGAIALSKLKSATTARELVGWGVVTLFFVSPVAGILMLIMDDEDLCDGKSAPRAAAPARVPAAYAETSAAHPVQPAAATPVHPAPPVRQAAPEHEVEKLGDTEIKSMQTELVELFKLKQQGVISAEEFEAQRALVLRRYYGDKAR